MSFQTGWSATAPRLARQAMREWLADVPCPDALVEDALLVISELTTNALSTPAREPRSWRPSTTAGSASRSTTRSRQCHSSGTTPAAAAGGDCGS